MYRIVALAILGIMCLALAGCDKTPGENQEAMEARYMPNDVPVATLFYLGFGFDKETYEPEGGLGTRGWNVIQGDSLYEGLVVTQPEIGWYASKDAETIEWQLAQMRRAGINVIFLSWQGWGDDNLDGTTDPNSITVEYDATAKMVLDYIRDHNLPFKFAIMVEDFPGNFHSMSLLDLTDQQRQMVMDHLWENYYSPRTYGELAFQWNGNPLVVGGAWTPGHWWEAHSFTDSRFELREIYDKPEAEGEHWTAAYYTPPPSILPGPEGVVMIWPRHDGLLPLLSQNAPWVTKETMRRVDPLGIEGAYDQAWREVIEYAPRADIKLIWIWIWNSYAEMTYIEPDWGLQPYGVGDLYVRKTAHYANLFRKGLPFKRYDDPDEMSRYIGEVHHVPLNLRSPAEKDKLMRDILGQFASMVAKYTGRETATLDDILEGLKGITPRIAANTIVIHSWRHGRDHVVTAPLTRSFVLCNSYSTSPSRWSRQPVCPIVIFSG